MVARLQIERRIETYPVPNFLAAFLRQRWAKTLEQVYLESGDESEPWDQAIATVEDLVWSVQPKKTREDRRHLVALLPSLLKRVTDRAHRSAVAARGARAVHGEPRRGARRRGQAAAPTRRSCPTAPVAEQAKAEAEQAKAAGDAAAAASAPRRSPAAMAPAEPAPAPDAGPRRSSTISSSKSRRASSAACGSSSRDEGGQLAFAKLAWVSPLRGTYLFTNRQGQKALSMTAEELAERFRGDRARLVEAEPLVDQAFTSMMASLDEAGAATDVRRRHARRRTPMRGARWRAMTFGALDHRRRDPLRQAPGQASRARHRDARAAQPAPRLGAHRRRRPRPADGGAARVVRARRHRLQLRRRGRDPRRPHAAGGGRGARRRARAPSGGRGADRAAVRRRGVSESRADGGVSRRQPHHSESGQSRRVVLQSATIISSRGFPNMAWPMLDWVLAHALRRRSPRRRRPSARSSCTTPARASCSR